MSGPDFFASNLNTFTKNKKKLSSKDARNLIMIVKNISAIK
jgi:hypothetical protein